MRLACHHVQMVPQGATTHIPEARGTPCQPLGLLLCPGEKQTEAKCPKEEAWRLLRAGKCLSYLSWSCPT